MINILQSLIRPVHRVHPALVGCEPDAARALVRAAIGGRFRGAARSFGLLIVSLGTSLPFPMLIFMIREGAAPNLQLIALLKLAFILCLCVSPLLTVWLRSTVVSALVTEYIEREATCQYCRGCFERAADTPSTPFECPSCRRPANPPAAVVTLAVASARRAPTHRAAPTPARRRVRQLVAVEITALLFAVGAYMLTLYRESAAARADRPDVGEFVRRFVETTDTGQAPDAPDAWQLFLDAEDIRNAVRAELASKHGRDATVPVSLQLQELEAHGAFDAWDRLAEPTGIRPCFEQPDSPFLDARAKDTTKSVLLSGRYNVARAKAALSANAPREFLRAYAALLGHARLLNHQPFLEEARASVALESWAFDLAQAFLATHPLPDHIQQLKHLNATLLDPLDLPAKLEADRVRTASVLSSAFESPSHAWFGRPSAWFVSLLQYDEPFAREQLPLGRYSANKAFVTAFFDSAVAAATLSPLERGSASIPSSYDSPWLLLYYTLPRFASALRAFDTASLCRRGILVLIELELHYASHGAYPDSLRLLAPANTAPEWLTDPYSGSAFGYHNIDPASDDLHRSFLLYSTGSDGADNGGRSTSDAESRADVLEVPQTRTHLNGFDFVINQPLSPR